MMVRLKKLPEIKAHQWDGTPLSVGSIRSLILEIGGRSTYLCVDPDMCLHHVPNAEHKFIVTNSLGQATVLQPGDWVVAPGNWGSLSVLSAEAFEDLYEKVSSNDQQG